MRRQDVGVSDTLCQVFSAEAASSEPGKTLAFGTLCFRGCVMCCDRKETDPVHTSKKCMTDWDVGLTSTSSTDTSDPLLAPRIERNGVTEGDICSSVVAV